MFIKNVYKKKIINKNRVIKYKWNPKKPKLSYSLSIIEQRKMKEKLNKVPIR